MQQLHQEIQDVKTRMEQLNAKIEEVANRCNRLCRPSAPAATNERLAEVKRAYEEYGQAVDVFVKSSTSENHARLQAAKKKLADLDEQ